jgi:alpha-2-macroglobulin
MVRPYLPRFLREGDRAELEVVVNNAGEEPLAGSLDFEVFDPDTEEDLRPLFGLSAEQTRRACRSPSSPAGRPRLPGDGAPRGVGRSPSRSPRAPATSPTASCGRCRCCPGACTSPSRASSPCATPTGASSTSPTWRPATTRRLIHDQLVVTVDAQLFYSVLNALPYLVNYPYECTEQT